MKTSTKCKQTTMAGNPCPHDARMLGLCLVHFKKRFLK